MEVPIILNNFNKQFIFFLLIKTDMCFAYLQGEISNLVIEYKYAIFKNKHILHIFVIASNLIHLYRCP